jgi:hypothetical protein
VVFFFKFSERLDRAFRKVLLTVLKDAVLKAEELERMEREEEAALAVVLLTMLKQHSPRCL